MKRSDFLKSLSALPLGIFAGNEIVKSIGSGNDNEQLSGKSTIDMSGLNQEVEIGFNQKSIHRPDLVEPFIKRTGGKIGKTRLYQYSDTPTMLVEYQDTKIISIGGSQVNKPNRFNKVSETGIAVKTHKTKTNVNATKYSDSELMKGLYDDLTWRIVEKNNPTAVILHSILLATPIYSPDDFNAHRSIMFRGAFITLES